uniref:Uncharacterized protein n=1 Tax=Anguilla anguilla TaxID=7936 RepID=A0A0E9U0Y2_ANGAN
MRQSTQAWTGTSVSGPYTLLLSGLQLWGQFSVCVPVCLSVCMTVCFFTQLSDALPLPLQAIYACW